MDDELNVYLSSASSLDGELSSEALNAKCEFLDNPYSTYSDCLDVEQSLFICKSGGGKTSLSHMWIMNESKNVASIKCGPKYNRKVQISKLKPMFKNLKKKNPNRSCTTNIQCDYGYRCVVPPDAYTGKGTCIIWSDNYD